MKIALAYNEEDRQLINKLETDLSLSGYSFVHFDFGKSKPDFLLYEALADYQWPILLFVSDKFLKSATSMTGMLSFFQKKEDQIYPILVPQTSGDVTTLPDIEKVGGIIKYINYWQEHYLDLRKQKKELHLADEDSFSAHLKRIREISTEVGEFLRQLRTSTYCNVSEFEAADYEIFFEFIDDVPAWEQFKRKRKNTVEKKEEEMSEANSEELSIEAELAAIPGFSLLPKEEEEDIEESFEPAEPEIAIQSESMASESAAEPEQEETQAAEEPETVPEKKDAGPELSKVKSQEPSPSSEKQVSFSVKSASGAGEKSAPDSATQNALDALRDNINRLTVLLKEKEEAAQKVVKLRPGNGKKILITGGTSGIGKATAEIFARNGFEVIITGRRKDRVEAIAREFSENHDTTVRGLVFDVRNLKEVEKALKSLGDELNHIDILINNAGKAKGFDPIHEGHFDHWEEMIDTNIKGLLYLTRLVAPYMVANQKGHIINIGSIAGKETYPNGNVYCATKFAVDGLTRAMRMDLHKHNIRVSQISPAHVEETEFALVRFDGDQEKARIYEDFTPVNSRDIAETLYFMATRPQHVNILDVVIQGTQQPSATIIDRSGRK